MNAKVGTFMTPAVAGNVSVSGLGFQPKALFILATLDASDVTVSNNISRISFGVDNVSAKYTMYEEGGYGGAPYAKDWGDNNFSFFMADYGTANHLTRGKLASFNADGFSYTIDIRPGSVETYTPLRLGYLAIGGADVTNTKVETPLIASLAGNQDITTTGFQPDMVIMLTEHLGGAFPQSNTRSHLGIGSFNASKQTGIVTYSNSAGVAQVALRRNYFSGNNIYDGLLASTSPANPLIDFVQFLANGYRINKATTAGGYNQGNLALKFASGFKQEIGFFSNPLTSGSFSVNFADSTLNPSAVIFFSAGYDLDGDAFTGSGNFLSMGFADGTNQFSIASADIDTANPQKSYRTQHSSFVMQRLGLTGAIQERLSVVSLNEGIMNLNLTGAVGVISKVGYIALGGGSAPLPSSILNYGAMVS